MRLLEDEVGGNVHNGVPELHICFFFFFLHVLAHIFILRFMLSNCIATWYCLFW